MSRIGLVVLLALLAASIRAEEPMAEARRWVEAKFLARPDTRPARAHLMLYTRSGSIYRNRIKGRKFRIAGREFERGVGMPSPGDVLVRLPGPAAAFEATGGG